MLIIQLGNKMKKLNSLSLLSVLLLNSTFLLAEDIAENEVDEKLRDRAHSVREVVQNVLKNEAKEISETKSFRNMFDDAKVTGQLELMYSGYEVKNDVNPYATAIGGHILYELAQYNGFNGGVEFSTTHNINFLSGNGDKKNTFISSEDESYTQMTQAFINYNYSGLNLRFGRQVIDTPLADSDDYRIINNTFEALIATYEIDDFSFMLGYLDRWQGTDAGLDIDNAWQDTGNDGTYFGGITYTCTSVGSCIDINAWYYDMSETDANTNTLGINVANKSSYFDISHHLKISEDYFLHSNAQYLNQSEEDSSGIESDIYGFMFEFVVEENLGFSVAYNKSEKQSDKGSFSGFGGGTLYTNMDNMILDNITQDRDARAIVAGVSFQVGDFSFLYAYGDFDGDADSANQKEHVVEQNIGVEYNPTENLTLGAICVISDDKENTGVTAYPMYTSGDFENYRLVAAYSF